MELHDGFVLERYKVLVERERACAAMARDAFATYGKFVVVVALGAVAMVSARESLGLDKEMMPQLLQLLGGLVGFLALVAVAQIITAMVRRHMLHQARRGIDPDTERMRPIWWVADAIFLLIIVVSLLYAWRAAAQLADQVARSAT
ncbi:MAG TPA: hypothetical protein VGL65_13545 [Gemmatimonadales bacterium]